MKAFRIAGYYFLGGLMFLYGTIAVIYTIYIIRTWRKNNDKH